MWLNISYFFGKNLRPLCIGVNGGSWGRSGGPGGSNFNESENFTNKSCQLHCKGDKNTFIVTHWGPWAGGTWGSPRSQPQSSSNRKILLTKVIRHSLGMKKNPNPERLTHSVVLWVPRVLPSFFL